MVPRSVSFGLPSFPTPQITPIQQWPGGGGAEPTFLDDSELLQQLFAKFRARGMPLVGKASGLAGMLSNPKRPPFDLIRTTLVMAVPGEGGLMGVEKIKGVCLTLGVLVVRKVNKAC